ncbi:hypothetical protein [Tsukamurella soli]|uniref:DUF222 domain-containing protein n=1 Tax=Tsukamurella soli TaxID=644556 RepID=A0ABP8J1N5_9ACTN
MTDEYSSGLGPLGDAAMIASMVGRDRSDAASYARLLTETLAGVLPADLVRVEYRRSLADRMAGRPGEARRITLATDAGEFSLDADGDRLTGEARRIVGGVVLSRKPITVEEWTHRLAAELRTLAARSDATRQALGRVLGVE